jgi:S-adenosylmethionine hydrolase
LYHLLKEILSAHTLKIMPTGPIITLTTDFGLTDFYVAAMKAVLLHYAPNATLIDVTHQIYRHDLRSASFTLERAVSSFPGKTVHLAVVDPGVGTDRRMLVVNINESIVVCPDNGLITWAWRNHPGAIAHELIWRPPNPSSTFHGRDIMSPVAGMIAAGYSANDFTGNRIDPILFDFDLAKSSSGEVIHIDHFGNATTNIPAGMIDAVAVSIGDAKIPIRRTYAEVGIDEPVAMVGSSNLLAVAIRNGSAADVLKINIGDRVVIT